MNVASIWQTMTGAPAGHAAVDSGSAASMPQECGTNATHRDWDGSGNILF